LGKVQKPIYNKHTIRIRFNRLTFKVINVTLEISQLCMETILAGMPNAKYYLDDFNIRIFSDRMLSAYATSFNKAK